MSWYFFSLLHETLFFGGIRLDCSATFSVHSAIMAWCHKEGLASSASLLLLYSALSGSTASMNVTCTMRVLLLQATSDFVLDRLRIVSRMLVPRCALGSSDLSAMYIHLLWNMQDPSLTAACASGQLNVPCACVSLCLQKKHLRGGLFMSQHGSCL